MASLPFGSTGSRPLGGLGGARSQAIGGREEGRGLALLEAVRGPAGLTATFGDGRGSRVFRASGGPSFLAVFIGASGEGRARGGRTPRVDQRPANGLARKETPGGGRQATATANIKRMKGKGAGRSNRPSASSHGAADGTSVTKAKDAVTCCGFALRSPVARPRIGPAAP